MDTAIGIATSESTVMPVINKGQPIEWLIGHKGAYANVTPARDMSRAIDLVTARANV